MLQNKLTGHRTYETCPSKVTKRFDARLFWKILSFLQLTTDSFNLFFFCESLSFLENLIITSVVNTQHTEAI
jgi:hypothetical protein